jgi:hypothetical protein
MPIKSPKQFRMMQAAANNGLKGLGPSPEIAKKFIKETSKKQRSKFASSKA